MNPAASARRKVTRPTADEHIGDVTVKDVAARAGVSTATVSRVLSGQGSVSTELEARVRAAVEALHYRPNQAARRLRVRQAKIIGVLVPDIQLPFFASIVVSIDKVLQEAGYLLLLGNTYDNPAYEQAHIDIFLGENVAGVIFAPANFANINHYRHLQSLGIPLVAFDRLPGDLQVDTVQISNQQAASRAVQHLIEEGHQRIGFVGGPENISTAVERLAGYQYALNAAQLTSLPRYVQSGGYTQEGGYQAMRAIMETPEPPSAVLIANNPMALGAMQYVNEKNLDVPCQVALIGFDDMPWASILRPPLTVVAQPVEEIGLLAARLMLDRIRGPKTSIKHVILETRLILRSSCLCSSRINRIH